MIHWKNVARTGAVAAVLSLVLCGAAKCTDTPPPSAATSHGQIAPSGAGRVADPGSKQVRMLVTWSTKPARHHDIELSITASTDKGPADFTVPWQHGEYSETYTLRAGDRLSVTADQQEDGALACELMEAPNGAALGSGWSGRHDAGSVSCGFIYAVNPASWVVPA